MRQLLDSYTRERIRNITDLINELQKEVNITNVHQLRVELKKTRFIITAIKFYSPKVKVKRIYKPFKELFTELAKTRGEHVNLYRKFQSEGNAGAQPKELKSKKLLKLEKELIHSLPHHRHKTEVGGKKLLAKLVKFPGIDPGDFARNLIVRVLTSLTPETPKKELHKNRHLLKGIVYASEISPAIASVLQKRFDMKTILELEDAIGDWHDLTILINKNKEKKILSSQGLDVAKETRRKKLNSIYSLIDNIRSLHSKQEVPSFS